MKHNRFSKILGKSKSLQLVRVALAAPALMLTINSANAEAAKPAAAAEPDLTNWIGFTIGGAFASGDNAGMAQRVRTNGDFYGGIDSMHYAQDINDKVKFTIDGHALPGLNDYDISMNLEKADLGYVKLGFKEFRTWYDVSGASLQGANNPLNRIDNQFNDEQAIDRGEFFIETGLRMENLPEVTFSYRHLYRNGNKSSISLGDARSNANWDGAGTGTYNMAFKMMPSMLGIDETTDIFELDVEHTLGNTELGVGLVYENYTIDDDRITPRWTTQSAPAATGLNSITLRDKSESDMFAGNVHSVTRFSDKAWLSYAASYSSMGSDTTGGTRTFFYDIGMTPQSRDYQYDQMSGGSTANQFITNLNFMWVPLQDLAVTPSLRYEHETIDSVSKFRASTSPTSAYWRGLESLASNTDMDSLTEALDIRYTGIDNLVLYGKGEWEQEDETINRFDRYLPDNAGAGSPDADLYGEFLKSDVTIDEQKYSIGANWYALSNLSFSIEGTHEQRNQELDHLEGNESSIAGTDPGGSNNFRPIMTEHNLETNDFNLRMTWRPISNVSLVTRYDYVHTEIENRGISWTAPGAATVYPIIESGDIVSHVISQSVSWNPIERLYMMASASLINSRTETPEQYTGPSDNDYVSGNMTVGYAIDDKTDITASYTYFAATNYSNSKDYNGFNTMGYGYNTEEHSIGLTLTRAITENMVWNLHYGFMTSDTTSTDQSGGKNDFDAQMVSTGLQVRF